MSQLSPISLGRVGYADVCWCACFISLITEIPNAKPHEPLNQYKQLFGFLDLARVSSSQAYFQIKRKKKKKKEVVGHIQQKLTVQGFVSGWMLFGVQIKTCLPVLIFMVGNIVFLKQIEKRYWFYGVICIALLTLRYLSSSGNSRLSGGAQEVHKTLVFRFCAKSSTVGQVTLSGFVCRTLQ